MPQKRTFNQFSKVHFSIPEAEAFGLSLHYFDSSNRIGSHFI